MSEIAANSYGHLLELTLDAKGQPNPRIPCTEGYHHASSYEASQLEALGLTPLGNLNRTSFVQTIEGSVDDTWCPPGIKNVIGMVPVSTFPDEYIVYCAHLDGPNNQNPETTITRGNGDTTNAYDNGLAVAIGLAMAKEFMTTPPLRSIVFVFDDAEEGFLNVGEWQEGEFAACERYYDTEWSVTLTLSGSILYTRPLVAIPSVKVSNVAWATAATPLDLRTGENTCLSIFTF